MRIAAAAVIGGVPAASRSATGADTYTGSGPIRAVATVGMVADIVRNVGGDRVRVQQLMGSGVDPHLYKATRDDVVAVLRADVVFTNGLLLEGKLTGTLAKMAKRKPVVAVAEAIDASRLLGGDAAHGGKTDPHVWMDPTLWSLATAAVADRLAAFDPTHAEQYREAAAGYRLELERLHEYGQRVLGSIPEGRRVLVTSHDAFSYFGRAYGLKVEGVQGISTESEAGLQRVNALVRLLVDRELPAVFVESSVSQKSITALVEGARARGHTVRIGGELFSDAMGPSGSYEGTYVGMLDHNITVTARSLGGQPPERGRNGKLASRKR